MERSLSSDISALTIHGPPRAIAAAHTQGIPGVTARMGSYGTYGKEDHGSITQGSYGIYPVSIS